MKLTAIKWIFLFAAIFVLMHINNRFEIFALNCNRANDFFNGSFRIMTYNVNAPLGNEDIEKVRGALIEEIEEQKPDILCIQELSSMIFKNIQLPLDSAFGYTDSLAIKNQPLRYRIYSKYPIRNFQRHKCVIEIDTVGLDSLKKEIKQLQKAMQVYSAEIEVMPDKWITVFACHLRSSAYTTARRSMDEDTSWLDGLPLYFENYKIGEKIRNWEADNIRLFLKVLEANDTPVIIAGDFNDWSGSYCMNTIRDGKYKDSWWEGGLGFGITYDGWHLKLRLDHILYSHHFKLENVYVEKSKFSDHRPLVADFTLLP
jgi:endonuclease/exonuclease/phosphatase family metal-dependent hydrolase